MLTLLLLLSHGVLCLAAADLPWQDQLCCESPPAHRAAEGERDVHVAEGNGSAPSVPPRCSYRNSPSSPWPEEASAGTCLDILCTVDEEWQNLMCDLQTRRPPAAGPEVGLVAVSLQRLPSQDENSQGAGSAGSAAPDNPVVCELEDSFTCSVALDDPAGSATTVAVSISGSVVPPVLLTIPARPVKPSPPVNLSHVQTVDAELILQWHSPPHSNIGPLRYELRYSANATHPSWQVASSLTEARLVLDLKPELDYSIQVRCSTLGARPLWSDWSESYHIKLYAVSYVPEKVVVRPGENVTVYCVFNDHELNASAAVWKLNIEQTIHRSQYRSINRRVSQITVRPSETQLEDMLQCTQDWRHPYSHIYVDGAFVDIECKTNGNIDAMDCSWNNTRWTETNFRYRWANVQCDEMQEEEQRGRPGGKVQEDKPEDKRSCHQVGFRKTCTIKNLSMNCYKLWLEVPSPLGPILSKPIYLMPRDQVKPHPPTNVTAVSHSSGVLEVTWKPPSLPDKGLQCQFRYHSPTTVRAQPDWTVQSPVRESRAQVAIPAMCGVYVVQVSCTHTEGVGYRSEWSDSVYSSPHNSRTPERGPDFWRILQDDPNGPQTKVTLLFKQLHISGLSYCLDGFLIQHRNSSGSVTTKRIEPSSSYSFDWDRMPQTVTVEAYNSLGSSSINSHMVLDRQPKRRCVRSFSVRVVNSTCVSLTWTLLENSSVPQFMVVQWSPRRHQGSGHHHRLQGGDTWARLPYTDSPAYLTGGFFASDDYNYYLYPVFADGEGEPVFATAKGGDAAVYQMLMIIFFLSVVLLVTLIISQHQMKKFVWKEVPDPNKCSWARELDFRRVDPLDHMFRPAHGLPAWPLLLPPPPPENISKLVIVVKVDPSVPNVDVVQDPVPADPADSEADRPQPLPGAEPPFVLDLDALTSFNPGVSEENSAQSLVTYATVLPRNPQQQQQLQLLQRYKDGSGSSSSSDEGNFSANNSDISGSFPGGLWELDDPRRSCSFNSVEQLSEQEDEGGVRGEKGLFYLGVESEEEEEEEDQTDAELLKKVPGREGRPAESHPLLQVENSSESPPAPQAQASAYGFSQFYLPQFTTRTQDGEPQP
ncbi:leptin receptor [Nelusetta ayraudi]|uniref:leptin receptor n=1 Tax=Nelusetta ayraudi TaxID=303726 RepID=UPI003F70E6D0